jgi:tetratricopeptide (TPR) repeat protein
LPSDTVLRLDQDTAVTFSAPPAQPTSWLDLLRGTLYSISQVTRGLRIRTPFVNASVRGTEFLVQVERGQTRVSVFEGTVTTANAAGSIIVNSGQTAIAARGQAPVLHAVVRPREAVHWALYYPPVLDPRPEDLPPARASVEAYCQGDLAAALARLEEVPARLRETRFYTYRASLRLYVGRVEEAQADLAHALRLDPRQGSALALQALIAVTQNDPEEARRRAQEAIALAPRSAAPRIALSYAAQAGFDLTQALQALQQAVRLEPTHALAWARLAELWLATGYLDRALAAAAQVTRHHPALSRTQTVRGYAHLAQFQVPAAQAAFERAIVQDSADPLPRLGLGLAKIRQGDLRAGTHEIEIAASLDPNHSLIRSYLGKAYYEQKREGLAATELAQAQALDPRDPTPWFYDAIREQTANRPVEALQDLEQAIALNDNRAVYRSRLLLDQDLAARSASLARIYRDLDFEQLALVEGWKSVNTDPSNYSAHRLLADSYRALPRHGVARVSELLQSQLLQPLNITPVQPQLAETSLFVLEDAGPAETSLNEYNPLFLRDRHTFQVSGIVGNQGTYGEELVYAGIGNRLSYSLGQFQYETEGFRSNNDFQWDIYNLFLQASPSYNTSLQAELRYTEAEEGDQGVSFFPEDYNLPMSY